MKQYLLSAVIAACVAGGVVYALQPAQHVTPVTKISKIAKVAWLIFGDAPQEGLGSAPNMNILSLLLALLGLALALWVLFGSRIKEYAKTVKLPALSWKFQGDWRVVIAILLIVISVRFSGCSPSWPTSWSWVSITAPFATDKLAVMVVEESDPNQDATAPTWVNSTRADSVRAYVEKRGGAFRLIDQHNPSDLADKEWQDALAVKRDSIPWIVAAGKQTGISQPLPATAKETIALLEGVK